MKDEYVPPTHIVRERYWLATVMEPLPSERYREKMRAEFDRWLNEVRAEAWSQGVAAKSNSISIFDRDVLEKNPYGRGSL